MQIMGTSTIISGPLWYASDWYGLLITVGGVGDDFSQTGLDCRLTLYRIVLPIGKANFKHKYVKLAVMNNIMAYIFDSKIYALKNECTQWIYLMPWLYLFTKLL